MSSASITGAIPENLTRACTLGFSTPRSIRRRRLHRRRGFGRDRTTVLHACHLIEDLRDDAEFDRIVAVAERIALAAFGART